jgi:hypothetical protein
MYVYIYIFKNKNHIQFHSIMYKIILENFKILLLFILIINTFITFYHNILF